MKFKIAVRYRSCQEVALNKSFERNSLFAASQFHGDFWNDHVAWSDKFRSTMYTLDDQSRRWKKIEIINW